MKKYFLFAFVLVFALSMITACGGGKKTIKPLTTDEVFEDPFQDMIDAANAIIDGGGVASVGQGISKRQDLAKKKAVTDAQGQLAEIFNTKVQKMKKSFQEEIGSADDSEINEAFTTVTKTLTSTMLQGAITKKVKYTKNKETGQLTAAALVAIEPNKVNMSIFDEMKKSKPKLYERFRASQAYDELNKEMKDYEKQQDSGF
jgi:hypothetical protein